MPEWNREPIKFRNAGMSTASPTDLKARGKYRRLSNVRSREDGSIQARPGLVPFHSSAAHPGGSISTIRKLSEVSGSNLLVVCNGAQVGIFSEVVSFQPLASGFSGTPVAVIAWRPENQGDVWAYVYDSNKQIKFSRNAGASSDVYEIGIAPPGKPATGPYTLDLEGAPTVADGGAGDLSGTYQLAYRYRSSITGARSEISALSAEITVGPGRAIQISGILASADPQVDFIDIFSIGGTLDALTFVASIANGITTYLYTTADILLSELLGETIRHKPWVVKGTDGITRGGVSLPYVWGPYQGRLLAVGAEAQPGTVFWTNGNDPDSMDPANTEEVTGTNEPLVNGAIWDTNSFLFSNTRMFATYPNVGGLSFFRHLPTPVKRGLIAPWCLAPGDRLYFTAKDGVFATEGGPESSISDDIYNMFPHEGALDEVPANIPNPGGIVTPDFRKNSIQPALLNLDYDDGFVRFTFADRSGTTGTMVWDKFLNGGQGGWYNDFYLGKFVRLFYALEGSAANSAAAQEVLCGTSDGRIFKLAHGHTDDGQDIICEVWTPFEDRGDPNARKRFGDAVLDYVDGDLDLLAILAFDDDIQEGGFREPLKTLPAAESGRVRKIIDINNGHGRLARNIGLLAAWTINSNRADRVGPKLYAWIPSSITKPEDQVLRTIEWHHPADGVEDVYVWGVELWIDTGGKDVPFELWANNAYTGIDVTFNSGAPIQGTDNLTSEGRLRRTWVGSVFRASLLKLLPKDHTAFWRLFKLNWLASAEPPLLPDFDTNWKKPRADCDIAYVTGLWVEAHTQGQPKALRIQGQLDGDITTYIPREGSTINHSDHKKTWLSFDEPFRADLVRISSTDGVPVRWYGEGWIAHCEPPLLANWDATFRAWERPHIIKGVEVFYFSPDGAKTANVQLEDTGTYTALVFPANSRPATIVLPLPIDASNEYPRAVSARLLGTDAEKCFVYRVRWLADPEPEQISNFNPVWTTDNHEGAKFLQGARVRHDTRGLTKEVVVDYDNGGITPPVSISSPRMDTDILTFDPPFITRAMRLRSTDSDNGFLYGVEWVWEPAPDLASVWQAQESTFDFPGWTHLRRGFLAYADAAQEVRLVINTSEGMLPTITLSASGAGTYVRQSFEPVTNKWLWAKIRAESDTPFRLFKRDCEFYMKPWGSPEPYQIVRPFGDYHRADGAKI